MRRLETGILVAALGGLLLLVSLFLDWYQPGLTAWDAFEVWDLVLAALALLVIAGAAAELGWWRGPLPAVEILLLGACALVVVLAALINHPPAAIGRGASDGAWLGLGGAVLMAAGGVMARVGISLSVRLDPKPTPGSGRPAGSAAPVSSTPPRGGPGPGAGGAPRAHAAGVPGAAPAPVPVRSRSGPRRVPAPPPEAPPDPPPPRAPGAGRRAPSLLRPDPTPEDETEVTRPLPRDPGPPPRR